MKSKLTNLRVFLHLLFKNPKILLGFSVGFSLFISVLLQHSLEVGIIRLILVFFFFKITQFLINTSPTYMKSKAEVENKYFAGPILEEQNFFSKWIDSTLSLFGGEKQTFHLGTVTYRFLIVKPNYFNLPYIVFCRFNQCSWFKKMFKLVISYPYFITDTRLGSFLFGVNFFVLFFSPNPFSMVILVETFFLFFALMLFFRFEGVYQYCIDIYGVTFVEKYIGNPLSDKFIKRLAGKIIVYTAGGVALMGLNIADQSYNSTMFNKEMDANITRRQRLGQETMTFDEYTEIENNIRKYHLPVLHRLSETLIELKKK